MRKISIQIPLESPTSSSIEKLKALSENLITMLFNFNMWANVEGGAIETDGYLVYEYQIVHYSTKIDKSNDEESVHKSIQQLQNHMGRKSGQDSSVRKFINQIDDIGAILIIDEQPVNYQLSTNNIGESDLKIDCLLKVTQLKFHPLRLSCKASPPMDNSVVQNDERVKKLYKNDSRIYLHPNSIEKYAPIMDIVNEHFAASITAVLTSNSYQYVASEEATDMIMQRILNLIGACRYDLSMT